MLLVGEVADKVMEIPVAMIRRPLARSRSNDPEVRAASRVHRWRSTGGAWEGYAVCVCVCVRGCVGVWRGRFVGNLWAG